MKIISKQQTITKNNNAVCVVTEYPLQEELMDLAIAEISGRYPDEKRVVNRECKELIYVFSGAGKVVVNHKEYVLSAGDAVLIDAGDPYYWEGHLKIFISCRPAWRLEQHQAVD